MKPARRPPTPQELESALRRIEGHVVDGKRLVGRPGPDGELLWSVEPAPKLDA